MWNPLSPFILSLATAVLSAVVPQPEDFTRDKTDLVNAVILWNNARECDQTYFGRTHTTLAVSNQASYWKEWNSANHAQLVAQNISTTEHSAYSRFAVEHWNGLDYDCRPGFSNGCTAQPTCKEIVKKTMQRSPHLPLPDAIEQARKIYFVMQSHIYMNQEIHQTITSVNNIQSLALAHVDTLVKDFAQQVNPNADFACHAALKAIDGFVEIMTTQRRKSPVFGEDDKAREKRIFRLTWKAAKNTYNLAVQAEQLLPKFKKAEAIQGYEIHLTPSYARGFCKRWGGGRKDDNANHVIYLRQHMATIFRDYVKLLEILGNSIAYTLNVEEWIDDNRFKAVGIQSTHEFEEQAAEQIRNWAISTIWNGGQCYQKCKVEADASFYKCIYKDKASQNRYCPPSDSYRGFNWGDAEMCAVACWSTIRGTNREVPLYGIDSLKRYGITIEDVQRWSHDNYVFHRNNMTHWAPDTDLSLLKGSGMNLNVCRGEYVMIADFEQHRWMDPLKIRKKNFLFPTNCGDWRSNETARFLERMGFQPGKGNTRLSYQKKLFKEIIPKQFETLELPPATRFLAYCANNIRFPLASDNEARHIKLWTQDRRCKAVFDAVADMNEDQGNHYFCTAMPERHLIFEQERLYVERWGHFIDSHQVKCRKKYGKEKLKGMDMSPAAFMELNWVKAMRNTVRENRKAWIDQILEEERIAALGSNSSSTD